MGSDPTPSWEALPQHQPPRAVPPGPSSILQALSRTMTLPAMKGDALLSVKESQKLLGAQDGPGL